VKNKFDQPQQAVEQSREKPAEAVGFEAFDHEIDAKIENAKTNNILCSNFFPKIFQNLFFKEHHCSTYGFNKYWVVLEKNRWYLV